MRDFAKVSSAFWTGETGRELRTDREAQVVALYLLTGPMANMIGLYHLPVALIADHTGIPFKGASKALRRVCDSGFARFDGGLEHVFIPEMAAYQIGEPLKADDNRVKGIIAMWQSFRKSQFYLEFHSRYRSAFHLPDPSPLQGACKPLRSQEIEIEKEQEQNPPGPPEGGGRFPTIPANLDTIEFRAAWTDWIQHRRERKPKLTPTSAAESLRELSGWGESRAIAAIRHSIAKGWQGIFEPAKAARGPANGKPSRAEALAEQFRAEEGGRQP